MSSEQIKELFRDMLDVEDMMFSLYDRLAKEIRNPEVSGIVKRISNEEAKHVANARMILGILDE